MVDIGTTINPAAQVFPVRARQRPFELPRNSLFSSLSRPQQRLLLPHIKQKRFKANKALIDEGTRNPGKIYIIVDGQVGIAKEALSPFESGVVSYEMGILRRGDIFGEVSFIDGRPSAVSYVAKTDITVAIVDLSAAPRNKIVRRVKDIVAAKLRSHLVEKAGDAVQFQITSLRMENELARYRTGVGHLVVTALCMLSVYTMMLSFMPVFSGVTHTNIALTPFVILMFSLAFIPVIATSGFPLQFFGLRLENWRPALIYALKASCVFLAALLALKWVVIHVVPAFEGLSLIEGADIEVAGGRKLTLSAWYWLALFVYLLLTPMQEFVARSGIQAPLYAFLHGSELKRRWWSILASNLVFAAAHAHISVTFALAAFLPGMLWGWIFARTNSLLASTFSHLFVGGVAIFLFGVEGIVSRL